MVISPDFARQVFSTDSSTYMAQNSKKNPDRPPVSIIILTYNGSRYIGPLLDSLRDQTYPSDQVEIIVIDNASIDDTVDIIQKNYPAVNLVILNKNVGFAAGNNQGLLQAKSDLLVFLNQDTLCHREWLSVLVETMVKNDDIAACNPNIITEDVKRISSLEKNRLPESLHLMDLSPFGYGRSRKLYGNSIYPSKLLSGCAFIIRRDVITRLGYLFDENLWMYVEDTDLSLRIHRDGHKICAVKEAVIYHFHRDVFKLSKKTLVTAARAIRNRVWVYYKNMSGIEFLLFLPLLFIGGNFKLFEFNLPLYQKFVLLLPYSFFSMVSMALGLLFLPKYAVGLKHSLPNHKRGKFFILKLLMNPSSGGK